MIKVLIIYTHTDKSNRLEMIKNIANVNSTKNNLDLVNMYIDISIYIE